MFEDQQSIGTTARAKVQPKEEKELVLIAERIESGNAAISVAVEELESLAVRIWGDVLAGGANKENAPVPTASGRVDAALSHESDLLKRLHDAARRLARLA